MNIDPGFQERLQLLDVEQKAQAQLRDPESAREQVKAGFDIDSIIAFLGIALVIGIVVTAVLLPHFL